MNCEQIRSCFSPLMEDELSSKARAAVRQHLEECRECRDRLQRFQKGIAGVASLSRHPVPRTFRAAVLERVEGTTVPQPAPSVTPVQRRTVRRRTVRWPSLAAGVLIGLAVTLAYVEVRWGGAIAGSQRDSLVLAKRLQDLSVHQETRLGEFQRLLMGQGERLRGIARGLESQTNDPRVAELEQVLAALKVEMVNSLDGLNHRVHELGQETRTVLAMPPSELDGATEIAMAEETSKAYVLIDSNGSLSLIPDWAHPEVVDELISLYEMDNPETKDIALEMLDNHFDLQRPGDPGGEFKVGLPEIFASQAPALSPEEQERRRVERYRDLWQKRQHSLTKSY
ncbi:MAG: zf-HC2 domain-containing protein [Planctomycetota bacterium]